MVIKGSARGGAAALAAHLQRTDTNEVAELREVRGLVAEDLDGALREIEAVASGARSNRPFYHASINTRADELMTEAQWTKAIDRLEHELGLTGQPRVVVAHLKKDRAHIHVAWSRIDLETMRAIPDSHNYRRHEIVSRELEREFGHARVQGAHIEREGKARPERTPSHAEMQQAERTGLTPAYATEQLTGIWNRTDSGKAFAVAIAAEGWILARGDKRDFVVLDPAGETHSLGRRIEGAKAKDVRARMADIDAARLPSVEEAKVAARARVPEQEQALATRLEPTSPAVKPASARELEREEQQHKQGDHPSTTTSSASLVAQQHEAQQRFESNSANLEAQRQARLKMINDAIERQGKRDLPDNPTVDRGRPRSNLER